MLNKIFTRQSRLDHPDPAQRLLGIAELTAESDELLRVITSDPMPNVRAAAVRQSNNTLALAAALEHETDPDVRAALLDGLSGASDATATTTLVGSDRLSDAERGHIARRASAPELRYAAIASMQEEAALLELALNADVAETRMVAAGRIQSKDALQKLADSARNKDNGVARLARQRLDTLRNRV
ncbi:MAG: hypothetical protein ABIS68_12445, partial [Casimicrobiaceae bacterium]